jgi:hypothetical protein
MANKVKFQFVSSVSPKYKEKGFKSYEPIEVDEVEFNKVKDFGYAIEVLASKKPSKKSSKKSK